MATASLIADSTQISQGAEAVSDLSLCTGGGESHNSPTESLQGLYSRESRLGYESSHPTKA